MKLNNYKPIIGLEVHVELKTKSKMFCRCSADYFGKDPNTHTCPVCLGLPGALPYPNKQAIDWCIMIGLALNCEIPLTSRFDRKNYFYPDLPKGYQISQYDQPFAVNGHIVIARSPSLSRTTKQSLSRGIEGSEFTTFSSIARKDRKKIRIRRVHMEEDTAKLMHQFGTQNSKLPPEARLARGGKTQNEEGYSLIDFNRSGVPLVEIVTEPDFETPEQVVEYLKKLQQMVRYLGVSDADMEKGEMRLEPNISLLSLRGSANWRRRSNLKPDHHSRFNRDRDDSIELPKYKVEVKNINSFRFVDRAIKFEIERQRKILESLQTPIQETRGWNETKDQTLSQRSKEEAHDYRYFPEPDIPPFRFTRQQIDALKKQMPELPDEKLERFIKVYSLSHYDAEILTRECSTADFFEEAVQIGKKHSLTTKEIANRIINKKIDTVSSTPSTLVKQIIATKTVLDIDEKELTKIIQQVVLENKNAVKDYQKGKIQVLGFLIGRVNSKLSGKKIDTQRIKKLLEGLLKQS